MSLNMNKYDKLLTNYQRSMKRIKINILPYKDSLTDKFNQTKMKHEKRKKTQGKKYTWSGYNTFLLF